MPKQSAGLLVFRIDQDPEVLLVHPGGPFWARKDNGVWSVPKGEYLDLEPAREAAYREFLEEVGIPPPAGEWIDLGRVRLGSGKIVTAFAVAGDLDLAEFRSNTFEMEWPRWSGRKQSFPEVDRAEWFPLRVARTKLSKSQVPFLDRLAEHLQITT